MQVNSTVIIKFVYRKTVYSNFITYLLLIKFLINEVCTQPLFSLRQTCKYNLKINHFAFVFLSSSK